MKGWLAALGATFILVPVLLVAVFAGAEECTPGPSDIPTLTEQVDPDDLPVDDVNGWSGEQLVNAAYIMNAATDLGLSAKGQAIGVMTAMGESSLVNIDYGDNAVNPDGSIADSIGLFQQQSSWGSVAERMNPTTSATLFFEALLEVDGWESLEPTIAAHRVQGNQNPYHYETYWEDAVAIVAALADVDLKPSEDAEGCGPSIEYDGDYPEGEEPPGAWGGYENGYIPEDLLAPIPWAPEHRLRGDAVAQLTALNEAYRASFGTDIVINDGYRDYDDQVEAKERHGNNAAEPGTSNHGWALAIDIGGGVNVFGTPQYMWMKQHGPAYGWRHPDWAEPGGSLPEPWHWEFWGVSDEEEE